MIRACIQQVMESVSKHSDWKLLAHLYSSNDNNDLIM